MLFVLACALIMYWVLLTTALKMGYGLMGPKKPTLKTDTRVETTELQNGVWSDGVQNEELIQPSGSDDTTKTDHNMKHD
jgi:hypothetical protein